MRACEEELSLASVSWQHRMWLDPRQGQRPTIMRGLVVTFLYCIISVAQTSTFEVPEGVKIKVASDADNASAKAALQGVLANDTSLPAELLSDTATCGPTLWAALKGSADETLLHSKVVTVMLSVPEPLQTVGRGLVTEEQR